MMQMLVKTVVVLVVLTVIASVAHAGAMLTWRVNGLDTPPPPRIAAPVEAPEPLDIGPILDLAPFGTRVVVAPPPDPVEDARPDSDWLLDLTLQGIIMAVPAERSLAMIAIKGAEVKTLGVGDAPLPGVQLKAVRQDGVLFEAEGHDTFLGFTTEENRRVAGVAHQRALIPQKFHVPNTQGPAGAIAPRGSADEMIDYYRQRIIDNPQTVLDGFGVSLTDQGYEIGPAPASGVTRAGLRPGDVIAVVNGETVGNIEKDRRLFEKVAASGHARVEILRDGRRVILSFPLK